MTCADLHTGLLMEIEYIRSELIDLAVTGADFTKIIEVSRKLDELIVEYYKADA
jgi:hypothetical protein